MDAEEAKRFLLGLREVAGQWELDPLSEVDRDAPLDDDSRELAREIVLVMEAMGIAPAALDAMDAQVVATRFGRVMALLADEPQISLGRPDEYSGAPLTVAETELLRAYRAGQLPSFERLLVPSARREGDSG